MEPWGFEAEDLRLGILASTVARAAGARVKPRDFMLRPPDDDAVEPEDQVAALDQLFGLAK